MNPKPKIIRITTVPQSLRGLLRGQLRFMSSFYEVVGISSGGPILQQVEKNEGVRTIAVNMTRKISPFKDILAAFHLYRIFLREKPLIVHTHTPKAGTLGMFAAKLAGVKYRLHTVAGLPLMEVRGVKRLFLDVVEKFTYLCATHVYPNSFGLYDIIVNQKYAPASKLKVIGNGSSNGVDTAVFNPALFDANAREKLRNELGIGLQELVFIYVGRLVRDKGIAELFDAFSMLYNDSAQVRLLLVGNLQQKFDALPDSFLKTILQHPGVVAVGHQPDVRPYLAIADALAFPSYREGFPNVVLQASAMGLPCIVSDINGCIEIITDGENGLIVPVKDARSLFEKMMYLHTNREVMAKMSSKSRIRIQQMYEQKDLWGKIYDEYLNLRRKYEF
jgi:glycosyltransferase involved in cell wall biosynthesis